MTQDAEHGQLLDRIYRYQRYIYDASRKYYLLGRDRLLQELRPEPGAAVLEVGCGTARNLIKLARQQPSLQLYGLDASTQMLQTADLKLQQWGLQSRVVLRHAYAERFTAQATFGRDQPFDAIFFSYALSMIPPWQAAMENALANLKPGGWIYIVDFSDQRGLPRSFKWVLERWLALFHVRHDPALLAYLQQLGPEQVQRVQITPLYRHYAFLAAVQKR